jgi:hypothetical protein
MNIKNRILTVLALVALAFTIQAANLIDLCYGKGAGSFERGRYVNGAGVVPDIVPADAPDWFPSELAEYWPGFARVAPGCTIRGWEVGIGVDWCSEPIHEAADGKLTVDLAAGVAGWIQTRIPTAPGRRYTVTFQSYGGQRPNLAVAVIGSTALVFRPEGAENAWDAVFTTYTFDFVADHCVSTLRFEATATDGFGPVIDDVEISLERKGWAWGRGHGKGRVCKFSLRDFNRGCR